MRAWLQIMELITQEPAGLREAPTMLRDFACAGVLGVLLAYGVPLAGLSQAAAPPRQGRASTQTPPDFTGTWIRDRARSENRFGKESTPGQMTVQQTQDELTLEYTASRRSERYRLDGKEWAAPNPNAEGGGTAKSTARWRAGRLTITSAIVPANDKPYRRTTIFSVSADGRELTVETTVPAERGKPVTFKQYWVRAGV